MSNTIPARLFACADRSPDAPGYSVRTEEGWVTTSYADYAAEVRQAARALMALGLKPGQTVCIVGFNRPEWVVFDLACMAAGGAPAGIYTTSSPDELSYIARHAEAPIILVEDAAQWDKVNAERASMPKLRHVVFMKGAEVPRERLCLSWEDFLARGNSVPRAAVDRRVEALDPAAPATLIYTSGTTGPPKGVTLSHENLAWTASVAQQIVEAGPGDVSLSYLPLSHIAEQMFSIHVPLTVGSSIHFARSLDTVPDDLKEAQPTIFFGVPRIWEKMKAGIETKMAGASFIKRMLATWAMGVGRRVMAARARGRAPSLWLGWQYALASRLVFSKVKPAIGLGRAHYCVSGAAPIGLDVLEFFAGLDLNVLEVYGQSEDTGPTTFNRPDKFRHGTVGPPVPGVEVRIAEDGEVLVKGPNVFLGYYKDKQATDQTLVDGWLHSGDLGKFDDDGFLHITGRKKDILITAGGKNITPKNIEEAIKTHPLIEEAVVVGDRRKFLTALITLRADSLERFAAERDLERTALHSAPEVLAEVQRAVDDANARVARVEQIKKFHVVPRSFTQEEGELTPTLKIKRRVVYEHFESDIDALYGE